MFSQREVKAMVQFVSGWNNSSQLGESTARDICLYLETFLVVTAAGGGREYQHLEGGGKDAGEHCPGHRTVPYNEETSGWKASKH